MTDNTPLLIALDAAMAKLDAVDKALNESRKAIVEADYLAREGEPVFVGLDFGPDTAAMTVVPAKPVVSHVGPEDVNVPDGGRVVPKAWADALSASIKANGPMMASRVELDGWRPRPSFLTRLKAWLGGLR